MTAEQKGGELVGLTSRDSGNTLPQVRVPLVGEDELEDTVNGNMVDTPRRAAKHGFLFPRVSPFASDPTQKAKP